MTSKLAKLGLFDANVPRYTSYPPAPLFNTGLNSDHMRAWVRALAPKTQISLYIHIPFCRHLCWFCACRTQGTRGLSPVAAYLDALKQEIALLGRILPQGVTIRHMHWGGGTPTLLSPDMIDTLSSALQRVASHAEDAVFSVEVDPKELDVARVDALARAGMTRASIGVQDFDPQVQTTIGRIQSFDTTRDATEMLRSADITSLNTEILFGLPHQTPARIATTVQKLMSLHPDRVALYGYAHMPAMARRQCMIPSDTLPVPEQRLALFETAQRLLEWDGYGRVGIDHFVAPHDSLARAAKNGRLRRSFLGYTDDPAPVMIGLGASAISRFPQGYVQNAPATSAYIKAITSGDFAIARGHGFTTDDKLRSWIIETIMCDFQVEFKDATNRFPGAEAQISQLMQDASTRFGDLVRLTEDGFYIRKAAQPLTRVIARHFDAYAKSDAGQTTAF